MIILASASPRRQELLRYAVSEFAVIPAEVQEIVPPGTRAEDAPKVLAELKASALAELHPDDTVIGSDTVVILDGEIFGKPANEEDARNMLRRLSGRTHKVVTGVCIISKGRRLTFSEETEVTFYPLSDEDIEEYIATGDPMDKAGAYGIQSEGCVLVREVKGNFANVVGLPIALLKRKLKEMDII
ncbi:MAG: Maf family protein [Huintestinicola sp.]